MWAMCVITLSPHPVSVLNKYVINQYNMAK